MVNGFFNCFRAVPKFIKRFKAPDYKDKHVFGVPLLVVLQRTGQPLPQCILSAMRCLRRTAMDAVGIFRKSGVRSRIQKLRDQVETAPGWWKFYLFCSLSALCRSCPCDVIHLSCLGSVGKASSTSPPPPPTSPHPPQRLNNV